MVSPVARMKCKQLMYLKTTDALKLIVIGYVLDAYRLCHIMFTLLSLLSDIHASRWMG